MSDVRVEDLQKRELEILKETARLLEKNNIPYFLAYGTTLGCIRHKGFIPWDDDIDIYIFGEDYQRLKEVFATQETGFLRLHDFETVTGYPYVFPKIIDERTELKENEYAHLDYMCGIYIDVFPLFEVDNNRIKRFICEKVRYFRYARVKAYYMDKKSISFRKKMLVGFLNLFGNVSSVQGKLYQTYINSKGRGFLLAEPNIFKEDALVKKEYFMQSKIMLFESENMPVPFEYEKYLSDVYGDYMKLPDEKDRISNHSFVYIRY